TAPWGAPVDAVYGTVSEPSGVTAVVEMARASGLALIGEARRDPTRTSSVGTGELIRAALCHRSPEMIGCIGGSATNDGGSGLAQALGVRLLSASGGEIGPGGASLLDLDRIDVSGLEPAVPRARFLVACDVDNPLTGPLGASVVYGPQKGATSADVLLLDRALGHMAAVIYRDLGLDVRDLPGGGAAGGFGAGMVAFLGARLRAGVRARV